MASTTVKLAGDNWATIRDPATLTNGERRPIIDASNRFLILQLDPAMTTAIQQAILRKDEARQNELLAAATLGEDPSAAYKVGDVLLTVMVDAWTLDLPIPSEKPKLDDDGHLVGSDILDDILGHDYDRLQEAAVSILRAVRWGGDDVPKSSPASRGRSSAAASKATRPKTGGSTRPA